MNPKTYEKEMNKRFNIIEKQLIKMIDLTNKFKEKKKNKIITVSSLPDVEYILDRICIITASIFDKLNKTDNKRILKKFMEKKMRKILGYIHSE